MFNIFGIATIFMFTKFKFRDDQHKTLFIINNNVNNISFEEEITTNALHTMYFSDVLWLSQFGDEHPLEIEALWSALVTCWNFNLKVIMRYLVIITNIAATDLLPYVSLHITFYIRSEFPLVKLNKRSQMINFKWQVWKYFFLRKY